MRAGGSGERKDVHVHALHLVGMKDGCPVRDMRTYSRTNVSGEQLYKNVVLRWCASLTYSIRNMSSLVPS